MILTYSTKPKAKLPFRMSGTGQRRAVAASLLAVSLPLFAKEYFDPVLLEVAAPEQSVSDLSSFDKGNQPPGEYRVDVYVNDTLRETRDLHFRHQKDKQGAVALTPCLSRAQLASYGVDVNKFATLRDDDSGCVQLDMLPGLQSEFKFADQQLRLTLPQAALVPHARGYIPPERWDNGINAMLLNYDFSGTSYLKAPEGGSKNSQYLNLRPGLNIGPWRLRNYTTLSNGNGDEQQWDTVYTYLQRSIIPLKSVLTLGDSVAPADVFDNVPFRGVQLSSDDDMLPESIKGYAPVVRGIARTNAEVVVRQNSYVIYRTSVAPGAFEITDIYPTGSSGDMSVTVQESDGSEQHFTVPFASLPVLQREGHLKYSLTAGQYRTYDSAIDKNNLLELTGIYGLPWQLTAYGGLQYSPSRYQSLEVGIGANFGDFGALSGDLTATRATVKNQGEEQGKAVRLRYNKSFASLGTTLAVSDSYSLNDGYYSLSDTLDSWTSDKDALPPDRRKQRFDATLSQNLWQGAGALTLSLVNERYWNSSQQMRSLSLGYNNNWHGINYSLSYSYNQNVRNQTSDNDNDIIDNDRVLFFNVSVPLDKWLPNTWASYSTSTSNHDGATHTVGMNGSVLEDRNLNWNVQESLDSQDHVVSGNINSSYKGLYGEATVGYSHDSDSRRVNYGVKGGVLVHQDGLTFSQSLGETTVLVKAPGASDVRVENQTGVRTDYRGYTVIPYATPYRENVVTLDNTTWQKNVDMTLASQTTVPTRGAVVRATFATSIGQRALLTLKLPDGKPVPFGAVVSVDNANSNSGGIVGDGGEVYLRGLPESGHLSVSWGAQTQDHCQLSVNIRDTKKRNDLAMGTETCRTKA